MFKFFQNLFTSNRTKVPLFWVYFNYQYYKKFGKNGSYQLSIHPMFKDDKHIKETLNNLVDYIRDEYNVDEF